MVSSELCPLVCRGLEIGPDFGPIQMLLSADQSFQSTVQACSGQSLNSPVPKTEIKVADIEIGVVLWL